MADRTQWTTYLRRLGVSLVLVGMTLYEGLVVVLLWSELGASSLRATDRVLILLGLMVLPLPLYLIGRFVGSSGRINLRFPGDVEVAISQLENRQDALDEKVVQETRKLEERLYGKVSTAEQTLYPLLGGVDASAGTRLAEGRLVLGSKNFSANIVVAELLAQYLEGRHLTIDRRFNLGGTQTNYAYIMHAWSDVFVDYIGTGCLFLNINFRAKSRDQVLEELDRLSRERFGVAWCRPIGTQTDYCMVMPTARAQDLGIRALSDLASTARGQLRYCGNFEFSARPDGLQSLKDHYGLRFASETMCSYEESYRLLQSQEADIGIAHTTDPHVASPELLCLDDDKRFFPHYDETPVVRVEALERVEGLESALQGFSELGLVNADLTSLIHDYDQNPQALASAARNLLQRKQRSA